MNLLQEIKQNYLFSNHPVRRIITINVVIFLLFMITRALFFLFNIGFSPDLVLKHLTLPASFGKFIYQPWSLVTYMFFHDGFLHILFNMLWLYWLGNLLQEYLGNRRVYQAYFLGGIFGGLVYVLAYNIFPAFSELKAGSYALGASAGVLSITVATATLLPDYEVRLLLFGFVKLKWIALVSVVLDLISIPNGNAGGHLAHLGGAVFGFLFIKQLRNTTVLDKMSDGFNKLFKPRSKLKVHYKTTYMKTENDAKPSQHEVDAILDKISRSGYDSLTRREKEILFKASKD